MSGLLGRLAQRARSRSPSPVSGPTASRPFSMRPAPRQPFAAGIDSAPLPGGQNRRNAGAASVDRSGPGLDAVSSGPGPRASAHRGAPSPDTPAHRPFEPGGPVGPAMPAGRTGDGAGLSSLSAEAAPGSGRAPTARADTQDPGRWIGQAAPTPIAGAHHSDRNASEDAAIAMGNAATVLDIDSPGLGETAPQDRPRPIGEPRFPAPPDVASRRSEDPDHAVSMRQDPASRPHEPPRPDAVPAGQDPRHPAEPGPSATWPARFESGPPGSAHPSAQDTEIARRPEPRVDVRIGNIVLDVHQGPAAPPPQQPPPQRTRGADPRPADGGRPLRRLYVRGI